MDRCITILLGKLLQGLVFYLLISFLWWSLLAVASQTEQRCVKLHELLNWRFARRVWQAVPSITLAVCDCPRLPPSAPDSHKGDLPSTVRDRCNAKRCIPYCIVTLYLRSRKNRSVCAYPADRFMAYPCLGVICMTSLYRLCCMGSCNQALMHRKN